MAVLGEFTVYTRLASNSWKSACLCLPSASIKDLCHHALLFSVLFKQAHCPLHVGSFKVSIRKSSLGL